MDIVSGSLIKNLLEETAPRKYWKDINNLTDCQITEAIVETIRDYTQFENCDANGCTVMKIILVFQVMVDEEIVIKFQKVDWEDEKVKLEDDSTSCN